MSRHYYNYIKWRPVHPYLEAATGTFGDEVIRIRFKVLQVWLT